MKHTPLETLDEQVLNLLPGLGGEVVQVCEDSTHFAPVIYTLI